MTHYIYPQTLKAAANMWLWSLRDFAIMDVAALLSIVMTSGFLFSMTCGIEGDVFRIIIPLSVGAMTKVGMGVQVKNTGGQVSGQEGGQVSAKDQSAEAREAR